MKRVALAAAALLLAVAFPAPAHERVGHQRPAAPAARSFPATFPVHADSEWTDWSLGGFGGGGARSTHHPIVFVHGNNVDAATWHPVVDALKSEYDYAGADLWALSYNGVGCNGDAALFTPNDRAQQERAASTGCVVTGNQQNVPDLKQFIDDVLTYTGAQRINIIAHSLGVTVARRTLYEYPALYQTVAGFVGIAGANHGAALCPPASEMTTESCDEIAANTPWLNEMNADESPEPTRWMTVYDGTGTADFVFAGPYGRSPRLEGALNCEYPGFYHNDLRVDPRIVRHYASFLIAVEAGIDFQCPAPPLAVPEGVLP